MENSDLSEIDWPSFISEVSDQHLLRVVAVITHLPSCGGEQSLIALDDH